jgi:Lar family restriction alleviation protein
MRIKQCPFCSGEGAVNYRLIESRILPGKYRREYRILCRVCGAAGPEDSEEAAAINLWNERRNIEDK